MLMMTLDLPPTFAALTFMAPLSEARAKRLVEFVGRTERGTVVDVGCGWAELLLRVVAHAPDLNGVGIDLDADAIAHGRTLATARGLAGRVTLEVGNVDVAAPAQADALISMGATHVWKEPNASAPLDYAGALRAMRNILPKGGRAIFADGIWSRPPTATAIEPLGGRVDEFVGIADLVDLAVEHGFQPDSVSEATLDEWDAFESGFTAGYVQWLAEHDLSHPDAPEVGARAQRQRSGYLRGYRGILGFAYLGLVAI